MSDTTLRQLRAEHLKRRADTALQQGNFKEAYQGYSEAIQTTENKQGRHILYSNRSLTYTRAQRYSDAIHDAQKVIELAPHWPKGQWRLGMACLGLKYIPKAIEAFARCWLLDHGSPETEKQLIAAIQKATVEQLGAGIMALLVTAEQQRVIEPAIVEAVGEAEQQEAWFKHLSKELEAQTQAETYRKHYLQWLKQPMAAHTAYIQRACMNMQAKCYLQEAGGGRLDSTEEELAEGYWRLGQSFAAEQHHPDQNYKQATKALSRAMDLRPLHNQIGQELQEAKAHLTLEQINEMVVEMYEETAQLGLTLKMPMAHGILEVSQNKQHIFRLETNIWFPQAKLTSFAAAARLQLRTRLAHHVQLPLLNVTIEGIKSGQSTINSKRIQAGIGINTDSNLCTTDEQPMPSTSKAVAGCMLSTAVQAKLAGVTVAVHIQLKNEKAVGEQLVAALQSNPEAVLLDSQLLAAVGPSDPDSLYAEVIDVTPGLANQHALPDESSIVVSSQNAADSSSQQLIEVPKPKLEMMVPYKEYTLVRSDGTAPERTKKHPFCMSRVHYSATDMGEEVWAQLADGTCRWRQTSSQLTIVCLKVQPGTPAKQLQVTLDPYFIKVMDRVSGEVYLEGHLERGIVPEDSVWEHGGGCGEEGCLLYLHKMNLELLRKQWQHSEMWWPRLFHHHTPIQWDDYDKDYSDLPPQVLKRYAIKEAIHDVDRQTECSEKHERQRLQEQDNRRKQTRQARLKVLRACANSANLRMQTCHTHKSQSARD